MKTTKRLEGRIINLAVGESISVLACEAPPIGWFHGLSQRWRRRLPGLTLTVTPDGDNLIVKREAKPKPGRRPKPVHTLRVEIDQLRERIDRLEYDFNPLR